jgi:endonuclease IV
MPAPISYLERHQYTVMQPVSGAGVAIGTGDRVALAACIDLFSRGLLDHLQAYIIPGPKSRLREDIAEIAETGIPIVVHAPHHGHQVNPCAPGAFETGRRRDLLDAHIETAMSQTFEAADELGAPLIVLHAGRYEDGKREEAERTFALFLDRYRDPRIILENLPSVYAGYRLLGNTAGDLQRLAGLRSMGFCLDFAHLHCTASYLHRSFAGLVGEFDQLGISLHHLSGSPARSVSDRHLTLDHPENGIDLRVVADSIRRRPGIGTTLELKDVGPGVFEGQLEVLRDLIGSPDNE